MLAQPRDETWWQGGWDLQELVSIEQGSHCGIESVGKKVGNPSKQIAITVQEPLDTSKMGLHDRQLWVNNLKFYHVRKWLSAAHSHTVKFCIITSTLQPSDLLHTIIWMLVPCNALLQDRYIWAGQMEPLDGKTQVIHTHPHLGSTGPQRNSFYSLVHINERGLRNHYKQRNRNIHLTVQLNATDCYFTTWCRHCRTFF